MNTEILLWIACAIGAYLVGSFSTSVFLSYLFAKKDIRKYGSGNAGTANMVRTFGFWLGALTFVGDALKGVLVIWLGSLIAGATGESIAGVAVILGHCFPVFLGFKGGKGIATACGVFLMMEPVSTAIVIGVGILIILIFRITSIASIIGVIAIPVVWGILYPTNYKLWVTAAIIAIIALINHRANIKRLVEGKEHSVDQDGEASAEKPGEDPPDESPGE